MTMQQFADKLRHASWVMECTCLSCVNRMCYIYTHNILCITCIFIFTRCVIYIYTLHNTRIYIHKIIAMCILICEFILLHLSPLNSHPIARIRDSFVVSRFLNGFACNGKIYVIFSCVTHKYIYIYIYIYMRTSLKKMYIPKNVWVFSMCTCVC